MNTRIRFKSLHQTVVHSKKQPNKDYPATHHNQMCTTKYLRLATKIFEAGLDPIDGYKTPGRNPYLVFAGIILCRNVLDSNFRDVDRGKWGG